jgi:hypothetical protein
MNKFKILLTSFLVINYYCCFSQDSKIYRLPNRIFSFSTEGVVGDIYEQIKSDSSSSSHLLLLTTNGQYKKTEFIYVKIDSLLNINIVEAKNDSTVLSKHFRVQKKLTSSSIIFLSPEKIISGFFEAQCSDISSHKTEIMLFVNHSLNKWVEIFSINTELENILRNENEYKFLFDILKTIKEFHKLAMAENESE